MYDLRRIFTAFLAMFTASAIEASVYSIDLTRNDAPAIALDSLSAGDVLHLVFDADRHYSLYVDGCKPSLGGMRVFSAHDASCPATATLILDGHGEIHAEVRDAAENKIRRFAFRDARAFFEETDLSSIRRGECLVAEGQEAIQTDNPKLTSKTAAALTTSSASFDGNIVSPAPVMIDIMLVFDKGSIEWLENSAVYAGNYTNFAVSAVANMNLWLENTDLDKDFWFRLVDVMAIDDRCTEINDQIIYKMAAKSGVWKDVYKRRIASGADLVSYIVNSPSNGRVVSGIGSKTGGTDYDAWATGKYKDYCYSCCAIWSVAAECTLLHEVGHNMGLSHSPTYDGWKAPATFDYSNGYNFKDSAGNKYHTIMAYDTDRDGYGYAEIPYFSSPLHYYTTASGETLPVGTALSNDCTRVLKQTCRAVSERIAKVLPLPSDVVFSPDASSTYRIFLSTPGGYEIRYTTDGTDPTRDSELYTEPLKLTEGELTVKAVAVVDGETLGAVFSKAYSAAVELSGYVWLEETPANWKEGYWNYDNGDFVYQNFWNASSDKTAVIDVGGKVSLDRDIALSSLLADGTPMLEIVSGTYSLSAANLHVFGTTLLSGTGFSFDGWNLHPESTLVLSPGEGKTATLGNYLALGAEGSTLAITNGTLMVTKGANIGDGISTLQNASLRIDNGGILSLDAGWISGYSNPNPLTINEGGLLRINKLDPTQRPWRLDGGRVEVNVSGRALEWRGSSIAASGDSEIVDTTSGGAAKAYICYSDLPVSVEENGVLTIDLDIVPSTDSNLSTDGRGIVKSGGGELVLARAPGYTGATTVNEGTLTVAYVSSATNGLGWTIAKGATLKIGSGCSIAVPSLTLDSGSEIDIPVASSAPVSVSNSVNLADVILKLSNVDDLSYGKEYPLISASKPFGGIRRMDLSNLPALADGLAWQMKVDSDTLKARIATEEEASLPVPFTSNNDKLAIDVPGDAIRLADGAIITSTPVSIDGIDTKIASITFDVSIPSQAPEGEAAICSWTINGNIVRCVRTPDGILDCWYGDNGHTDKSTKDFAVESGRHLFSVVYYSVSDNEKGGTYVYVDGELAYRSPGLRWSGNTLDRFTIGATANETPRYAYKGLTVYGVAALDLASTAPLSGMTASGCSPSYGYFNGNYPTVFGLPPTGGFMMDKTNLVATLDVSSPAISVSTIASFPADAKGSIMTIWTRPADLNAYYTVQAEYSGDGSFFLRYNGNTNTNPFVRINDGDGDVENPHVYTLAFSQENGVAFYQDGTEILHMDDKFKDTALLACYKVNFGYGAWDDENPNPMPDFKVYASHIAMGTDDRTVSESAVDKSYSLFDADPPTVDVLVAFDNGAQSYVAAKGVALSDFAQTQIDRMNAVLATNRLDAYYSYRLAGTCNVDATYARIGDVSSELVAGVGPLVSLRAQRELCGADTVTLLVNNAGDSVLGYSCPLSSASDVASCHEDAFSVCSIVAVDTGNQHTMIHENAHNMGCGHSRAQAQNPGPSVFSYGSGSYFDDNGTARHTIMAYDTDGTKWHAPSWYFSTSSSQFGLALGDAQNDNARVLRETCGYVARWRNGAAQAVDDLSTEGAVWRTSAKFPWHVDSDGCVRSPNHTDYSTWNKMATMPLAATVTGPKRLSFSHKSYFWSRQNEYDESYSHFDVLVDDSPVLAQIACTNSWTETSISIPEGEHEVVFVYSQRNAMNNPADYKDGTPEADDAVWLKDIALLNIDDPPPDDDEKPSDRYDIPGSRAYIANDEVLEEWLDDANFGLYDGTWQEFMEEKGANGYLNWVNFVLGLSSSDPSAKIKATISFDAEGRVVVSVAGSIPHAPAVSGAEISYVLMDSDDLESWPAEGTPVGGKTATIERDGSKRFYRIDVSIH